VKLGEKIMSATTFDVEVIEAGGVVGIAYADGAVLFNKGDEGECAYIVKRGRVRIGTGIPIEVMLPGEVFGEMALIDDEPRSAAAVAVGVTEVLPIDRPLFGVLMRDDSDFAMTVMRLMVRRLRATLVMLEEAVGVHGHTRAKPASASRVSA
jgi:CRP/FNR family transcriptional regulator, cyclic AMP receptor protein